jgi:hypothetical protein
MSDKFPRTTDLPTQSPLFWVQQKDRYLRQLLIRDIEAITKRSFVAYFTNQYAGGLIDHGDVPYFTELLDKVHGQPIDLFIETPGGLTDATDSIIQLLLNLVTDLRVIVANSCKSNGTLLGLAAKSIVMGASSELGPIEPLVNGTPCSILKTPEVAAQNFALHKLGVYAAQHSEKIAKTLLTNGMMKGQDAAKIDDTVRKLSTRDVYHSHGSTIDQHEAQDLGLTIEYLPPDDELWKRIWLLYCMYDFDCKKNGYLKVFESGAVSTAIAAARP